MDFIETTANEFAVSSDDGQHLGYVWLNGESSWTAQAASLGSDMVVGFKDKQSAAEALENGEC